MSTHAASHYAGRGRAIELDVGDVIEVASRALASPLCMGILGGFKQHPCPLAVVLNTELNDGEVRAVLALIDNPTRQMACTFDPELVLTLWEAA